MASFFRNVDYSMYPSSGSFLHAAQRNKQT